jgi:hypothetical protein
MDEQRKHAYHYLLYWAMLEIRPLAWLRWGWNPLSWRRESRRIRCAGATADWLHNLALFSSMNFEGFNEEWFWRDFEWLRSQYPDFGLERYHNLFERQLGQPRESATPGKDEGPLPSCISSDSPVR